MTWLIWRQQRRQALAIIVALVVAAAVLLASGLEILATYHNALRTCSTGLGGCSNLDSQVFQGGQYSRFFDIVDAVGFLLPLMMALFWGAPLVAREFEEGTHRLAWTQSVTRLRWLGTKLACALGAAVLCSGVISALVTWWYHPVNAVQHNRFDQVIFDTQALVPVGYAVFGVALGCLLGTLLRRTVPAMAATVLIWGIFRYVFDEYLRPHLLAAHSVLESITKAFGNSPAGQGSWVLGSTLVNGAGRLLPGTKINPAQIPATCRAVYYSDNGLARCLSDHGYHYLVRFQPASNYWPAQGIELAIYVALAAVLVSLTYWKVARADA
jgi:ABC-type transport system involved in multi-copper enzyme maturation permease subunit